MIPTVFSIIIPFSHNRMFVRTFTTWIICLMLLPLSEPLKWLSLSSLSTAAIDGIDFCSNIKGLERRQKKVCRQHIEMMSSVLTGAKMSVEECQHQFKSRRWNCSMIDQGSIFGSFIIEGTKEAAYIHSIAAAGVSFAVTKGCSRGELPGCGCDMSKVGNAGSFEWAGCSDNVVYGTAFSKKFTDSRERLKKANGRSLMNLHNNQAGREVVEKNMKMECKCHGVSGSCELRTCWRSLPSFRNVGHILREAFDDATEVKTRKSEAKRLRLMLPNRRKYKPYSQDDLVYLRPSPNFCERNEKLGSLGTSGRECNNTSTGSDRCDFMCCGRGFRTIVEYTVDRCNCKFHWCCFVKCDECMRKVEKHICL